MTHAWQDAANEKQANRAHFPRLTCDDTVVGVTGFEPVAPSV